MWLVFKWIRISNSWGTKDSDSGIYQKAAVAADNEICSDVGKDILLKGGNAVDEVIATEICTSVLNGHSCGLDGGHFLTVYSK